MEQKAKANAKLHYWNGFSQSSYEMKKKTFIPKHLREISLQQFNETIDKVYDKQDD